MPSQSEPEVTRSLGQAFRPTPKSLRQGPLEQFPILGAGQGYRNGA